MNIFIGVILFLLLYWRIRILYQNYLTQRYRYKLFAFRDRLRRRIINNEIERSMCFHFIDASISKCIEKMDSMNIFAAILTKRRNDNNKIIIEFKARFIDDLETKPVLKESFEEFQNIVFIYNIKKHFTLSFLFFLMFYINQKIKEIKQFTKLRIYTENSINSFQFSPETSSIEECVNLSC